MKSIEKIASVIRDLPNPVRLEGHTDSVPIHNQRFPSNWELSAARSIAMLQVLTGQYGIPNNRFAVAGYAETKPIDTNESEEGRTHNRRVDIVILNQPVVVKQGTGKPVRKAAP
jgi:chemotaxis protein MotB